jgi:hypothetical protein
MESLTSGTLAGMGSFRCRTCGYVLTLASSDALPACPGCAGTNFVRASLFSTGRPWRTPARAGSWRSAPERAETSGHDLDGWIRTAREGLERPGEYLLYEEDGRPVVMALKKEWTRIGRSLLADLRFDDPTVSRRHALVIRRSGDVRILDDRSLNGVFVNGARVDGRLLHDGDELEIGRYRLSFARILGQVAHSGSARRIAQAQF